MKMKLSQAQKLYTILQDGNWHCSFDLVQQVYNVGDGPTLARLGARIWDVKQKFGVAIESRPDPFRQRAWQYRIIQEPNKREKFFLCPDCASLFVTPAGGNA